MAKKKVKKDAPTNVNKYEFSLKIVTSEKCDSCRKCDRGLTYLEKMSQPGAVGYGVPCILTKGKAMK